MTDFRKSSSLLNVFVGIVFFLMADLASAQIAANQSVQSRPSTDVNRGSQQSSREIAGSAEESTDTESRIGPDDLLNISVFEAPEMNCTVRVTASGDMSTPLLGAIHAAGLTPRELESVLQSRLRATYMKDPHVGVFVQELQSHAVSVVGAVKMPGVFQIRGTKTLIEILSMAQGLADDAGNEVLVMHGAALEESTGSAGTGSMLNEIATAPNPRDAIASGSDLPSGVPGTMPEIVTINIKKLLDTEDSGLNVPVRPGDIVKVPRAGIVYVVGEVTKPGGFVLQNNENISVLQALALAEGLTHTSAVTRARIIRTDPVTGKRYEIPANLARIFSGKSPDMFLQPKDVVFVPNTTTKSVLYRGSEAALQTAAGVAIYKW